MKSDVDFGERERLLSDCAASMSRDLEPAARQRLARWAAAAQRDAGSLASTLLSQPDAQWTRAVHVHRAHHHPWYDELAERVDAAEYAAFLLENRSFPSFLPMLERVLAAQICSAGRAAVARNIAEEDGPPAHAALMRRMMTAIAARAGDDVRLESYPSLVERTLTFYYGYHIDPWHLTGSLFVTEALALHRVTRMGTGLRRLGLDEHEIEFIRVHSQCDELHAREWQEEVIGPSVRARPALRPAIARGVALCLETSARYLDDLLARARSRAAA